MEQLASSLQTLHTGDASGAVTNPAKDLASSLDPQTAPQHSLEQLPVELQQLIMFKAPSLQSLRALIQASPELHRVYVKNRMSILRHVLAQVLEGTLVDALSVYRSGTDTFQQSRQEALLLSFLEEQEAMYTATDNRIEELPLHDMTHLFRFHASVIEPLTEQYATWALASLPSSTEARAKQPLSNTERIRIQRGMYRLQLFCNLCGYLGPGFGKGIESNIDRVRVLSMFPAWEVEEILCIHHFAKEKYTSVFRQVAWDLNEERNPKYSHVDMTSVNEDLLLVKGNGEEEYINERPLNAVLRYGLHLLVDTLNTADHEKLVNMTRVAIETCLWEIKDHYYYDTEWLDDAVSDDVQAERRERWYADRDYAQDTRQKMSFDGDKLKSPPLAWTHYWWGEYSNLFGSLVADNLRDWGFVMWDAARFDETTKGAINSAYVAATWHSGDPRAGDYDSDNERERYESLRGGD